ncbi:MAG: SIMPL domain-containing protein [Zetaproteobacteria bacterium]|nr:SIMPL domain-containing protein [Zetaproteobacteria bacterium]
MNALAKFVVCLCIAAFMPFSIDALENGIEVSGSSDVRVPPDIANFSFAISDRGNDLVAMKKSMDQKSSTIVALCKKLGVDRSDISSTEISIHPQYNYQTRDFLGYDLSRVIQVTLHGLEKYSDLVNGAIEAGVTNINRITLDTSTRDAVEREALTEASESAKKKAQLLAQSHGVELGRLLSIEERGQFSEDRKFLYQERAVAAQNSGAFEPGEISIRATIVVKYAIQ